jgi:hypothetical protein
LCPKKKKKKKNRGATVGENFWKILQPAMNFSSFAVCQNQNRKRKEKNSGKFRGSDE